ncbi:MAG: DUF1254 domain-containing protein [Pleurocapsa sp. MO_226.B13]|nr:DUF1254 domain-containing protein [Pleurocapsa sp. MO_226.B13]
MTFQQTGPIDSEVKRITAPPSPPTVVNSEFVGDLHFENEYPTQETVQKLYDQLDFQRACQVFMRNITAASMYSFRHGLERDLGWSSPRDFVIWDGPFDAHSLMLTPNSETVYGLTYLDLKSDGPTVAEVPAGMLGVINDMWMREVGNVGPVGPDQGAGGRFLFLPPGYSREVPEFGFHILRPKTYGVWFLLRAFRSPEGDAGPAVALHKQVRIYPLSEMSSPPAMKYVNAAGKTCDTIHPVDIRYFEDLADLVNQEHDDAIDKETRGILAAIGIVKGQAFDPDERMQRILKEAAKVGSAMALATSYDPRLSVYRYPDRQWIEIGNTGYPKYEMDGYTVLDGLSLMGWFATVSSIAMVRPFLGKGSVYMWAYKDGQGEWLDGGETYKLHLPPNPPAANFWSIVLYDVWTRAMLANGQVAPSKNSYDQRIQVNDDGSIDFYFGPEAPEGQESNWIRTLPGKGFFVMFRLYGPLEGYMDRSWKPSDIEIV